MVAIDWWKERRARKGGTLPDPPEFTDKQIDKFTNVEGLARRFDVDVADNIIRPMLRQRSVAPLRHPDLDELGKVWAVMPLTPGYMRASEVVERAHRAGRAVLGSLSLVLLPTGSQEPMVLIVGAAGIERHTMQPPGGPFAVLAAPQPAAAAVAPPPPVKHANGVTNGAALSDDVHPDTVRPEANGTNVAE